MTNKEKWEKYLQTAKKNQFLAEILKNLKSRKKEDKPLGKEPENSSKLNRIIEAMPPETRARYEEAIKKKNKSN